MGMVPMLSRHTSNPAPPLGDAGLYGGPVKVDDAEPKHRFLTIEQVAEELSAGVPLVRSLLKTGEMRIEAGNIVEDDLGQA